MRQLVVLQDRSHFIEFGAESHMLHPWPCKNRQVSFLKSVLNVIVDFCCSLDDGTVDST